MASQPQDPVQESIARIAWNALFKQPTMRTAPEHAALQAVLRNYQVTAAQPPSHCS